MDIVSRVDEIPIVLVVGNKYVNSYHHIAEALTSVYLPHYPKKMLLIANGTNNVHQYVQDFAEENGLECQHCSHKLRRELIRDRIVDECVVLWDDESQHLYDLARDCKQKHIPVKIVGTY